MGTQILFQNNQGVNKRGDGVIYYEYQIIRPYLETAGSRLGQGWCIRAYTDGIPMALEMMLFQRIRYV
jgi:hypothetical protein